MTVLENGTVEVPTGTTYGEVGFVSCDEGYVLQGDQYIVCQSGPVWSSTPVCVRGRIYLRLKCQSKCDIYVTFFYLETKTRIVLGYYILMVECKTMVTTYEK